jgi:hypothetical protein
MSALALAIAASIAMAGGARAQSGPAELEADQLYRAVAPSVHLVAAVATIEDIKNKKNINQGSAVAIGERELVTNCHVVKDKPLIFLLRDGGARPATLGRSDVASDLCTLAVTGAPLAPVAQIRSFASLAVGERVYTIGSPKGLENTLGGGLIAGLRKRGTLRLVQITAPISQGSSGGGLFDRFGNLVGITSFFLNEAQAINFALSMDDFARIAVLPPAADGGTPAALPPAPGPTGRSPIARGFSLELVVARTDKEAQQTWTYLNERYGDLLAGLKPETQRFELPNKGTFYRLLAGVVPDRGRASALCREITQRGHATCLVR